MGPDLGPDVCRMFAGFCGGVAGTTQTHIAGFCVGWNLAWNLVRNLAWFVRRVRRLERGARGKAREWCAWGSAWEGAGLGRGKAGL